MLRSSMNEGDISGDSSVRYYTSPREMMNAALPGKVNAACIWELVLDSGVKKRGLKDQSDTGEKSMSAARSPLEIIWKPSSTRDHQNLQ